MARTTGTPLSNDVGAKRRDLLQMQGHLNQEPDAKRPLVRTEKFALTGETNDLRRYSDATRPLLRSGAAARLRCCHKASTRENARRSGFGERAILHF